MEPDSIYRHPKANLDAQSSPAKEFLADRGQRFAAWFLDVLVTYGIILSFILFYDLWDSPSFMGWVALHGGSFLVFLVFNGYLLFKHGQTIGKRAAKIKIVDLNGNLPEFSRLILRRYLPITLAAMVPMVGRVLVIIDSLMIFRRDFRCAHDLVAGTKVVRVL